MAKATSCLAICASLVLFASTAFGAEAGVVAYYSFEEGSGNVLEDHSGNGNHGQIHGADWVKNGGRWALQFDGKDDYVDCGDTPSLDLRDALTLEAWIYAEPYYSVWLTLPILGNGRYQISQKPRNGVQARAGGRALGFLPYRTWVHLAQSWDGKHLRLYVDGTLASLVNAPGPLPQWIPTEKALADAKKIVTLPDEWRFQFDAADRGLEEGWHEQTSFENWTRMRIDKHWTMQGEPRLGVAWYATSFEMPEAGRIPLLILFGAIDGYCDVFIDGRKVGDQKTSPEVMWKRPFGIRLDKGLAAGRHTMVIRVKKESANAGIHKPIWIVDKSSVPGDGFLLGPRIEYRDQPLRFKGRIASVRLYNRALTHEEILENIRTSNITNSVTPMPIPQPGLGRIKVEVDAARLGQPLENVAVTVDVLKADAAGEKALISATVKEFDRLGRAVVDLDAPELAQGDYIVRTTAKDAAGKALGVPGEQAISWAGSAQFPSGPEGARRLNNLVTELLRVPGPDESGAARTFVNPRTGFIYVSNRGSKEAKITAPADGRVFELALAQDYGEAYEVMRYLPKGMYTISTPVARDLIVRAVAQTVYVYAHTVLPVGPRYVYEFGPYHGEFEERYVFPHYNTLLVLDYDIDKPFVKEWKAKGRRILAGVPPKARKPQEGQSPLEALTEGLAGGFGFSHPLYDGYLFDEFGAFYESDRTWTQALEQLLSDPRYKGRVLHAWTYAPYDFVADVDFVTLGKLRLKGGEAGREFVRTLAKYDGALQWECCMDSWRTELDAWRHVNGKLVGELLATERVQPGIVKNLIVAPYAYVTAGPQWLNMTLPSYDSRTYLEMQVQTVATHPAFEGARGFATFCSTYADEETMRWTARLFRHYAIEGNTEPLGMDPFLLAHIRNNEFEERGLGWDVKPAEEDSIRFGVHPGFGRLQGRYPSPTHGDTVLITKRSAKGPNVFSQEIKNLEPGQLYSFRMFSADHKNMSRKETHAVTTQFNNATLIPEKCFTHVSFGTRAPRKFMNWHVRVFRADGTTATLTVSDWANEKTPGGPIGQELMYNFIKVQPYWPPD